jgi:hypothetical protein
MCKGVTNNFLRCWEMFSSLGLQHELFNILPQIDAYKQCSSCCDTVASNNRTVYEHQYYRIYVGKYPHMFQNVVIESAIIKCWKTWYAILNRANEVSVPSWAVHALNCVVGDVLIDTSGLFSAATGNHATKSCSSKRRDCKLCDGIDVAQYFRSGSVPIHERIWDGNLYSHLYSPIYFRMHLVGRWNY